MLIRMLTCYMKQVSDTCAIVPNIIITGCISYYHIMVARQDSTPGVSNNPFLANIPLLPQDRALSRIHEWQERAERGNYDPNVHIVDPQAHRSYLYHCEYDSIAQSEYHRCGGSYNLDFMPESQARLVSMDTKREPFFRGNTSRYVIIWNRQEKHSNSEYSEVIALASLRKSYEILCNVLNSFENLRSLNFCTGFLSILVKYPGEDAAALRSIHKTTLDSLKHDMSRALDQVMRIDNSEGRIAYILSSIANKCHDFLDDNHLGLKLDPPNDTCCQVMDLTICRMTTWLLDLALVSYVGCHSSQFDALNNKEGSSGRIRILSDSLRLGNIVCSLEPLTCLHDYLDESPVWVFSIERYGGLSERSQATSPVIESNKLSVLTTMDVFADVWGPVWSVEVDGDPKRVWHYNLPRGCIVPTTSSDTSPPRGITICHWNASPAPYLHPPGGTGIKMDKDQLLLIGSRLRVNKHCDYTLSQYTQDCGSKMEILGTAPETWGLDTLNVGITVGQIGTFACNGVVKKKPKITIKASIWNQLHMSAKRTNMAWLDHFLGVEISHCSGNARRVRMRELLCIPSILARLTECSPGGMASQVGQALVKALKAKTFQDMLDLWNNENTREQIAGLITPMVEYLEHTGNVRRQIAAAYFEKNQMDRYQIMELEINEWAIRLQDSTQIATYAVISQFCLLHDKTSDMHNCLRRRVPKATVLQTKVIFEKGDPSVGELVRLYPHGDLFKVQDIGQKDLTMILVRSQEVQKMFHPRAIEGQEFIDGFGQRNTERRVIIMSTAHSWGGMREPRSTWGKRHKKETKHKRSKVHDPCVIL